MRVIGGLIGGMILSFTSKALEAMGDHAAASGERLFMHLMALAALVLAGLCFLLALTNAVKIMRGKTAGASRVAGSQVKIVALQDAEPDASPLDADAALANYLAKREQAPPADRPATASRPHTGFGRRGR